MSENKANSHDRTVSIGNFAIVWLLVVSILASCSTKPRLVHDVSFIAKQRGSVFELTKNEFKLVYDSSAAGVFVKSVNGREQTRTSFWLYKVNSKSENLAADKFVAEAGDTITWELSSSL